MKVLGSKVYIFIAQDSYLKGSALLRPGASPPGPRWAGALALQSDRCRKADPWALSVKTEVAYITLISIKLSVGEKTECLHMCVCRACE